MELSGYWSKKCREDTARLSATCLAAPQSEAVIQLLLAALRAAVAASRSALSSAALRPASFTMPLNHATLAALGASATMVVPKVYAYEDGFDGGSFLIMEYMAMSGRADQETFGRKMAEMHLAEPLAPEAKEGRFGFAVDK